MRACCGGTDGRIARSLRMQAGGPAFSRGSDLAVTALTTPLQLPLQRGRVNDIAVL